MVRRGWNSTTTCCWRIALQPACRYFIGLQAYEGLVGVIVYPGVT